MYKIGYDTIKAYYRRDMCRYLSRKLQQDFQYNSVNRYDFNGADIYFSFVSTELVKQTSISFSIPTLLYRCNTELADVNEAVDAVELVSEIIGLDFQQFDLSRLDATTNLKSSVRTLELQNHLQKPKYFKGYTAVEETIYWHTAKSLEKSGRVLTVYQKDSNLRGDLIRAESRFISRFKDGVSAGDLIRRFLKHEAKVSELIKESFYINSVNYLYALIKSTLPRKADNPEAKAIAEELCISLEDNLWYSLPSSYKALK